MIFQREVQMYKDKDQHKAIYRENDRISEFDLNDKDSLALFQKIKPNTSFSTPDSMIQGLLKNSMIVPSFLQNNHFTNKDFSETLKPIHKEMKEIIKLNKQKQKNSKKRHLNKITRKKKKSTTERVKRTILRKLNVKRKKKPSKSNKSNKSKKPMKTNTKTNTKTNPKKQQKNKKD